LFPRSAETASRTAALVLLVLCLSYATAPFFASDVRRVAAPVSALMVAAVLAYCLTFARVVLRAVRGEVSTGRRRVDLVASAIVAGVMYLGFGPSWTPLVALSAGAGTLALTRNRAVPFVAVLLLIELSGATIRPIEPADLVRLLAETLVVTAVVFALGQLSRLGHQLERQRAELARLAVLEERLRFARDVHDVLGHTLSVIALKSEVAARLGRTDPERALAEMDSVAKISRNAIGDVRALVRGYRSPSLDAEVKGVAGILDVAGIRCEVTGLPATLPEPVQEAFAWVVREGVTNILRHSSATFCRIDVRIDGQRARLEITNDGVGQGAGARSGGGSGLTGLGQRLDKVGGVVEHSGRSDGVFRVVAAAPVAAQPVANPE
jgi:two-component system, NarL family, sensor histidine kinase DesK